MALEPTEKSPQMERVISRLHPEHWDRRETILAGKCMGWDLERKEPQVCDAENLDESSFRDDLSRREYTISGLCQRHQDQVWPEDIEPDEDDPDYGQVRLNGDSTL